ncbi:hypothetical protein [Micromonospora thermarum]|uniref:Ferritin-like domain-containing protein n=1 Tax=Micromonospora thermarum TaxID=2720024 RepID=A0ABX0Z1S3_9ACTN|nr:hypothetical protein [Micromonospora thermarum]NJP31750.1 hypothetical protein [Micromonospora thermarum]
MAPLTGCDPFDRDGEPAPGPDPLAPLVDEALALAAAYREAAAAHPTLAERLTPIAEAHATHAAELARVARMTLPSATATGAPAEPTSDPDAALATLREREKTAREAATRACAEAPADRAALLASVTAARAAHLEALR